MANGGAVEELGGNEDVSMIMWRRSPNQGPDPSAITAEMWVVAEEAGREVLNYIHPTLDTEEKRKDVIDYLQRLIRDFLGFEVYPYGSVPLKTYLPDGDIDLTVLGSPNIDEYLPEEVLFILQEEELNENAEFQVKGTQFIDAEVKLVKCVIQDIVIDLSFNQLGGLCSLCFLEQVDQLVGKDHLFKRSILLIKAWCYYESRILGANHGLMSTYALETLVLYIFHLFHSSFNGPIEVLYRFLHYYSKFDWDNYCISINGPVRKSTLPDIVVEKPDNGGLGLLLSEEFLKNCMELFAVPSKGPETTTKAFPTKHLNIIDPLKEYNNLGRSVHRGNFYRVRSAFKYGARKLGRILSLQRDRVADEIKSFYANTLERHGRKRHEMLKDIFQFGREGSLSLSCSSPSEVLSEDGMLLRWSICDLEDDSLGMEEKNVSELTDELDSRNIVSSQIVSESYAVDRLAASGNHIFRDANDLSSSSSQYPDGISDCHSNHNTSLSMLHGSQFYPFKSSLEYDLKPGDSCRTGSSDGTESNSYQSCIDKFDEICSKGSAISSPKSDIFESFPFDLRERDLSSLATDAEPFNPLADLAGDYDGHVRSLLYGQGFHGLALSAYLVSNLPSSPSQYWSMQQWDTVQQSMPLGQNYCSQMNSNYLCTGPSLDWAANHGSSYYPLNTEDPHKARGLGTYFPDTNYTSTERPSQGERVRNRASGNYSQSQRHTRKNGQHSYAETNPSGNSSYEVSRARSSVNAKSSGSRHYSAGADSHVNGFNVTSGRPQFGSYGNVTELLSSDSSHNRGSSSSSLLVQGKSSNSGQGQKKERVAEQSLPLKNEEEFPPLSM